MLYYRINVNGIVTESDLVDLATSYISSPSICGDGNNIYVVYRESNENNVKVKYSTDGGANWNFLQAISPTISVSSIESVYSKNKLHIVYELNGDIYRRYFDFGIPTPSWSSQAQVSPSNDQYIYSNPRIGIWNSGNEDKVYFTYNNIDLNQLKWREFNVVTGVSTDASWNVTTGVGFLPPNLGFAVDDLYIYGFYKSGSVLAWQPRQKSNNGTPPPPAGNSNNNTFVSKVFSTTTVNNKSYTAAWSTLESFPNRIVRMGFDYDYTLLYDVIHTETGLSPVNIVNLSSAGNEVHVIWKDNFSNNKLRYKYDDQVPSAPINPTLSSSIPGAYGFVKFSWTPIEPDIQHYEVWRKVQNINSNYYLIATQTDSFYIDEEYLYTHPVGDFQLSYKVKAVDFGDRVSAYSNIVSINAEGNGKLAGISKDAFDYSLQQNYPNPFNPLTKITYALAEDAKVQIKVYDMLGTEIAELVNEAKSAGIYETTFNASELSSGVYVYRITALNGDRILFSQSKQMILLR